MVSASSKKRVVITGLGAVSPLGCSKESLWAGLIDRKNAVAPLTMGHTEGLSIRFAAESRDFTGDIDNFGPLDKEQKKAIRKGTKLMCRECQMGVAAAQIALGDAGVAYGSLQAERTGVSFGSDYMLSPPDEFIEGIRQCVDENGEFQFSRWGGEGLQKMSPLWLLKFLPNMPASHIAIYNDFRGPSNSVTLREASGNIALGEATQIIVRGSADLMLVGCTGTRLHSMKTIHAVQQEELALADVDAALASRPFDKNRTGEVLGEGAGALVIESLESAKARGATIYGEVLASASSFAANRPLIANRRQAVENVLKAVLASSGLSLDDVGHINAHGLGTRTGDVEEAQAIAHVFAGRSTPIPVVAPKSNFGNLGAGGGVVELIASVLALGADQLFPTLNYETPDPECPVSVASSSGLAAGTSFINLSYTPQGQASAVLVRRFCE